MASTNWGVCRRYIVPPIFTRIIVAKKAKINPDIFLNNLERFTFFTDNNITKLIKAPKSSEIQNPVPVKFSIKEMPKPQNSTRL